MALTLPSITDCCRQPCACTADQTGGLGFWVVPTIAALRATPGLSTNKQATVGSLGSFVGLYVWNPSDTSADNGTTIIETSDAPASGRWNRIDP